MKNINRIFLFGDSLVEGQGTYDYIDKTGNQLEPDNLSGIQLSLWRKKNSWNKFFKEKTNCEIKNFARQGANNYEQFFELNRLIPKLKKTDLVVFGLTSKLRESGFSTQYAFTQYDSDGSLLNFNNPLNKQIAWEKNLLEIEQYCTEIDGHAEYSTIFEKKFTKKYVEDFFVSVYNPVVYETLAQANYMFYQNWFKENKLNIIFIDLFEPYVDPIYLNEFFRIDTDIYITHKKNSMIDYLMEYERNSSEEFENGIWEMGYKRPDLENKLYHPNQHGYKLYVDYLFNSFLYKKFKFK